MPTEKLITYLPTSDNTILYVMITLVSINLMILLYKFLTRKLQHSTIAFELSTGHDVSHFLWLNVLLCPKMYHYLARENFSHRKVEGWIRPSMLLWERGQIAIVNFLDHSKLQIPQKIFVSVWQGIKLRIILKQLVYCYVIAQHGSHAFHVKVCPMTRSRPTAYLSTSLKLRTYLNLRTRVLKFKYANFALSPTTKT